MKRDKIVFITAFLFFSIASLIGGLYMAMTYRYMKKQETDTQIEMMNLELERSHEYRVNHKRGMFKPSHAAVTFIDPPKDDSLAQNNDAEGDSSLNVNSMNPDVGDSLSK